MIYFNQRFKKLRNRKGFTLVELIVVIVIIGILAAIMIPKMTGFTDRAKATEALVIAKQVATAYDAYYAETGTWIADGDADKAKIATLSGVPATDFTIENDGGVSVTKNSKTASRAKGDDPIK